MYPSGIGNVKRYKYRGECLIDMAVKRILTTVNNALSLRFLDFNSKIC